MYNLALVIEAWNVGQGHRNVGDQGYRNVGQCGIHEGAWDGEVQTDFG